MTNIKKLIVFSILFCLLCSLCTICLALPPITSPFGWRIHPISGQWRFHAGLDIGYDYGADIVALHGGRVVYAAPYGGYGNCIIVEDYLKDHQLYAHCSELLAKYGDIVATYQVIAKVGSTGYSTGPHLHVEYWKNGQYVNPIELWR